MGLTVDGVAIADERVEQEMSRLREDYVAYVQAAGGDASEAQLREWAEENLIEGELLRKEALATQPEPSDERAMENIEACRDFYDPVPEGERLARSKEALRVRALEKSIRKGVRKISEDEVRREYEAHPEYYVTGEKLRLSHICRLIGQGGVSRSEAYVQLLRIKADVASGALSWYDALPLSDTYRQDYGMFPAVAQGELPEDIESKLFSLEPGGVSDVLELDGRSLHVFRLLAKDPPGKLGFQEVRETIRGALFEGAFQEALEQALDALKAKAVIRRES